MEYVSARRLEKWTVGLLAAGIVMDVIGSVSTQMQIDLLDRIRFASFTPPSDIAANDQRQQIVGVLQLLVLLLSVIWFLRWQVRANTNLAALNAPTGYTSKWVVGAWFVPFLNLFKPFQITKEMWHSAAPREDGGGMLSSGIFAARSTTPALLTWWWAAWIASSLVGNLVFRTSLNARTAADLITNSRLSQLADLFSIAAAILCIVLVRRLTDRIETFHAVRANAQPAE